MNQVQVIVHRQARVLTTGQLAESYGTETEYINRNFNNNKERYKEGKHFFLLTGERLKEFKMTTGKNDVSLLRVNKLYLWTEKGAWLHAKSLNTDAAWDAYEMLVDEYYKILDEHSYMINDPVKRAEKWIEEQKEKQQLQTKSLMLEQRVNELQPKATYYDLILQNKSLISISVIAKDYGMGAQTMNKKLHDLGVQYKQGEIWLLYAKYQDKGYTQTYLHAVDAERTKPHTKWTQAGRIFIYELLKREGIVPMIERKYEEAE
ncbi:MAG: phage antirepressor KilAC domain-containing protein [Solibacillus sp.]